MSHDQRPDGDSASSSAGLATIGRVSPFALTEVDIDEGCREIQIIGELDLAVAPQLQEAIDRCKGDRVLIDLESCQFIDSTGIAVILNAHRGSGARVLAHSPRAQVHRVLDLTGLTGNGLVFADRQGALSALGATAVHSE
jgi:anti-sigma B factor antagonist